MKGSRNNKPLTLLQGFLFCPDTPCLRGLEVYPYHLVRGRVPAMWTLRSEPWRGLALLCGERNFSALLLLGQWFFRAKAIEPGGMLTQAGAAAAEASQQSQ